MSSKFTCRFCKEQFDVPKGLYKHLQSAHAAGPSRDNRTCPICGVLCVKYEGYRDHLLYIHGQTDEGLKLTFKSLNEFLVWKAELELKHNCKYVLQSSPKVLPSKEKKYFYQCDRSDSKDKKDKKSLSVVMKTCSSVISVVEGINVFKVEYWDTHSGHSQTTSTQSLQNELEAAISSVEMVNAIADSDDSDDRSEDILASGISSPSVSSIDKETLIMKSNSSSSVNSLKNSASKKKTIVTKTSNPIDGSKKKSTNTIFSLASVACGKGIKKKPPKTDEKKSNSKTDPENSKSAIEEIVEVPSTDPEPQKNDIASTVPVTVASPLAKNSAILSPTITTSISTSLTGATKTVSSGLPAIAPKITNATAISTASYTTLNSLISSNSAFPNQLVIVNPVGLDQNSLNSKQNVLTAGQNILLSLGSSGQNIIPSTSQSIKVSSAGEKKTPVSNNAKRAKLDSPKITTSSIVTQSILKTNICSSASTSSSSAPVTLKSGLNNSPVILSSLPIGSTFMSVNNNLIPIATPSGAFLPTSLPPNIVLTPVVSTTSGSNTTQKSIRNSVTITKTTKTVTSNQPQVHYTPSSTVAVTVSSIVKEPIYYSSAVKQASHTVASSSMPISSASTLKTYAKNQNKTMLTTMSGTISPLKNVSKFMTSTPVKSKGVANANSLNKNKSQIAPSVSNLTSKLRNNVPSNKGMSILADSSVMSAVTVSSISSPKNRISAKKRLSSAGKSKPTKMSANSLTTSVVSSPGNTKVVNSQLNLAPISSTVTPQPMDISKPGTLLIESSGDYYMIEPMDNALQTKHMTDLQAFTKKIISVDRSVQTAESDLASLKPKIQRKRAATTNEDSAVMLKVKCYKLEVKYLNILAECKRLKVELTKERLKNAELSGEKSNDVDEGITPEASITKASGIMKEIEENFSEKGDVNIYTMTKTSVLRGLYEDLEELYMENTELNKELENYRTHDKFYKSLKKKLYDEEF